MGLVGWDSAGRPWRDTALATVAASAGLDEIIARRVGEPSYNMWFRDHTRLTVQDQQLIVGVANRHQQEWLAHKYGKEVEAAARDALGQSATAKFVIDPELFRAARAEQEDQKKKQQEHDQTTYSTDFELPPAPPARPTKLRPKRKRGDHGPSLFPEPGPDSRKNRPGARIWRDLKHFVVGACNRVAFAAAQSVIDEPGQNANPLTIHGPVGTGKTHLLEGIYCGLRKKYAGQSVRFVTAEDFTNRFVASMKAGKLGGFRRQFRDCDVLLLDNLHFLTRKKATIEEFKHTFDVLTAAGKQIVVTTDCHPRLAEDLHPEVVDRLLGGAVWGLQPPDAKARLEILRNKAGDKHPSIPDDVLQHLASRLRGNVRELEGAVNNLRHFAKAENKVIDLALTTDALGDLLRHAARTVSLDDIEDAVCKSLRLKTGALQSSSRNWNVSHPRMVAVYLARKHTSASYSEIGKHFGGRNHSTAVAAEKKVRQWVDEDAEVVGGSKPWRVREIVEAAERLLKV